VGLKVLVDYDNVPASVWAPGPVSAAAALCDHLPASVVGSESELTVRLYGGWKTASQSTHRAQQLIPQLTAGSHIYIPRPGHAHGAKQIRLLVQLALSPLGSQSQFETTLAKDRSIRSFRPKSQNVPCGLQPSACGLGFLSNLTHRTPCSAANCTLTPQQLLVRDEQKMVDTLMVADMAHAVFVDGDRDIVVVTSDTDIWPGVLLAIKGGCAVTQIHPTPTGKTAASLVNMLPGTISHYFIQIAI
jgi:hypothetical protein